MLMFYVMPNEALTIFQKEKKVAEDNTNTSEV